MENKIKLKEWARKSIKIILILLNIVCLFMVIYSAYNIFVWKQNVDENNKVKEDIDEKIKVIETIPEPINGIPNTKEIKYEIDFAALKEQNSDTIGYINVNNTNISYIFVKGTNNSYYLNHNFNKESNIAGWIFADYNNKVDESDRHLIIYGHNTKDGSMFGTLKNTLNKDWYTNKDNYKVILVTEKGQYTYQVFSNYSIEPEDYYINTIFNSDSEFDAFVKTLKSRSIYNYNVDVSGTDKILTLSSCMNEGAKRVVLHAKLINE